MDDEEGLAPEAAPQPTVSVARAALLYTAGRFGLFGLVALIVYLGSGLVGSRLNGLPLLLVALLVSSLVGLVLFSRQRAQLAAALAAQRQAKTEQIAARRARLDETGTG
ncbi:MAG: DUF4229 domain-containing protein [Mycobacteriales bacterium]